uniref:Uncharacterized protein n=1 Tax=Fagus sylvatica TaxID=28930 RepID=A0A2N9GS11_FAGSY
MTTFNLAKIIAKIWDISSNVLALQNSGAAKHCRYSLGPPGITSGHLDFFSAHQASPVTTWVSFQLHFDLGPFLHHQVSLVASNFSQLAPPKPRRLLSAARAPPSLAVALRFSISSCRHHSLARGDPRFLISCGAALSLVALIVDGSLIRFWDDVWCIEEPLKFAYLELYRIACVKDVAVADFIQFQGEAVHWEFQVADEVRSWRRFACRRTAEVLEPLHWEDMRGVCRGYVESLGYKGVVCSNRLYCFF